MTILTQHQFAKYAAAWSRHVSHHQDLTPLFQLPDGSQLRALQFSLDALEYLLSTVGARRIKAQFLLLEDEELATKRFSLALYATDAADGRISAYYQAGPYLPPPSPTPPGQASQTTDALGEQIPNALVHTWLDNWKNAAPITPAMFGSNYGPLTGYTFEMGDFLDSFFYAQKANKELLVLFGLHQHYPAFPDCHALKQTFGLVLRMHQLAADSGDPSAALTAEKAALAQAVAQAKTHADLAAAVRQWQAVYDDTVGQPFYDMSAPSPPN